MRDKILEDLKSAMKAQDKERLAVIRMVKGAMQMEELNKKHELSDDEVIEVISKQIKTRKESIKEFEKGGRFDLIEAANGEIDILMGYMPKQLTEDEVLKIIDNVFASVKPTSIKDMGCVMKEVTPLVKGRADMGFVSKVIKEKLN